MKLKYYLILFAIVGMTGCNKFVDLPGFDERTWQADKNGCTGVRYRLINDLKIVKDQLKGLNADELMHVLGKPDKNELYKRSQKFFIYEIANAETCPEKIANQPHVYLSIRFNATGLAKEVMIYRD